MNKLPSIGLIGVWITLLLCVLGLSTWMIWSIRTDSTQIHTLHVEIQELLQKSASLDKFKKIAVESKKEKELIETYLISTDNQISFIEEIEAIGRGEGALTRIDAVSDKSISGQNRSLLTLNVYVRGSWQETMRTLDLIETMPHKIDINKLDLRKFVINDTGSGTSTIEWEASFVVNAAMTK